MGTSAALVWDFSGMVCRVCGLSDRDRYGTLSQLGIRRDHAFRCPGTLMLIRSLLMPTLSARWLSEQRLLAQRARAEARRARRGEPHRVLWFHQVDDPYSALVAQVLPSLVRRYAIECIPRLVPPPDAAAAPDRPRLLAWSRQDAHRLADHHGLRFVDPGAQPTAAAVILAAKRLLQAIDAGRFVDEAAAVSEALWAGVRAPCNADAGAVAGEAVASDSAQLNAHWAASARLRGQLGHYLGGMFHYAGEWYWGLDRLHHLERRLQALGIDREPGSPLIEGPVDATQSQAVATSTPIEFFFSFRSPYSAIAAPRVFRLGQLTGAAVQLRPLLPMVMRGLPVPAAKRRYIALDAAREARWHGVDFGRLNDPVGRPTERGLAVLARARQEGLGERFVLSFMQGVWAQGLDAGRDAPLRQISERAGLSWSAAQDALGQTAWRNEAEANRLALLQAGLWGVPSFRVGTRTMWGQDRLWAVAQCLLDDRARIRAGQV